MHRVIWEKHHGSIPENKQMDHINRNTFDNRLENLRLCSSSENHANQSKTHGSSDFKGVTWHKNREKWQVQIQYKHKYQYIGVFDDEIEAAAAYDAKARELFGEFAATNAEILGRSSEGGNEP